MTKELGMVKSELVERNGSTISTSTSLTRGFLGYLHLVNVPSFLKLKHAIGFANKTREPLIILSTICPPYSTDKNGKPTYEGLGEGITPNISEHLNQLSTSVKYLIENKVPVIHKFLMADTEVDLQPFLANKLNISPEEFISRCQKSVDKITARSIKEYGSETYQKHSISPAGRFIDFFGEKFLHIQE